MQQLLDAKLLIITDLKYNCKILSSREEIQKSAGVQDDRVERKQHNKTAPSFKEESFITIGKTHENSHNSKEISFTDHSFVYIKSIMCAVVYRNANNWPMLTMKTRHSLLRGFVATECGFGGRRAKARSRSRHDDRECWGTRCACPETHYDSGWRHGVPG